MIKGLYRNTDTNRKQLVPWERKILDQFEAKMADKEKPFPCIPATIGFSLNQIRYGFVGDPRNNSTILELAGLLRNFTHVSRELGNYTSLIVFYHIPMEMKEMWTVEQFEQLFWQQLHHLATVDDIAWPRDIPTDPHHPLWEFCFAGERYFVYCATPAHEQRKSRHFDTMMLAITPRWVLQDFNRSLAKAEKIKGQVRKRLSYYDTVPIHPDLNMYGAADNFEWKQYFLRDEEKSLSTCPYHSIMSFDKVEK
ncbi:YqcI/YcgG family protein [Ornithinibacillus salinisoli]|uniref:YqcI/YcgG family protein n=1 Tax=Ornithinibacillus salinisoli TaxID=1848459 RepID=A0ABW4W4A7_9BACI